MWIIIASFFCHRDAYQFQKLRGLHGSLFFATAFMGGYCFAYLVAYRENWIKSRMRVLENHTNFISAHILHFLGRQFKKVIPVKDHFPLYYFPGTFDQAQNR